MPIAQISTAKPSKGDELSTISGEVLEMAKMTGYMLVGGYKNQ
jgi:hypothetical protein